MSDLTVKYRNLWTEADSALRAGSYTADTLPRHGDPRWGLSLVVGIENETRSRIAQDLGPIATALSPHHFVYSPENLHSTVRSLEGYQDEVPREQVSHYEDQIRRALRGCPPIEIELVGLAGSKGGIFVCGYPNDGLTELRRRLHDRALADGPRAFASNDYRNVRDTAHVSAAVFQAPVVPEQVIGELVAARSEKEYGRVKVSALDLVSYSLDQGAITMNRLATITHE
ncbi:2'-5' RNA ligase family protein [Kitasatospora sp. NPDC056138]|uniref:2'-5' RNA ligase family protein n=1 Tax=Kitasatospora sp. NPDC056138 TaxID=3345724 RepID=UPI0035DF9FF8